MSPMPPNRSRRMLQCLSCGYSLDGLHEHRCPECGKTFDPDDPLTHDANRRLLRTARLCLWIAAGGTAYALLFVLSMVVTVCVRVADYATLMDVFHTMFSVLACCTPLVLAVQIGMMIAAPLVARYERPNIWRHWWVILITGVLMWYATAFVLLTLLAALVL